MADWPREIKPEDRIKYLIEARAAIRGSEFRGELRLEDNIWSARLDGLLIGEYDTKREAEKALFDQEVVTLAIQQAWEDVAT